MLGTAQKSTGFPKYRSRLNISQPCATTPALPANESEITISSGDLTCSTLKAGEFSSHRSEEHTSELQSLMRISYAVFCLKKKNTHQSHTPTTNQTTNTHYIQPYLPTDLTTTIHNTNT